MNKCKCSLRTRLVGDGCEHCNPELTVEYLREQLEQAEALASALEAARDLDMGSYVHIPLSDWERIQDALKAWRGE